MGARSTRVISNIMGADSCGQIQLINYASLKVGGESKVGGHAIEVGWVSILLHPRWVGKQRWVVNQRWVGMQLKLGGYQI